MESDDEVFGGLTPIVSEVDYCPIFFHLECVVNKKRKKTRCLCGDKDCFLVRAVDEASNPVFLFGSDYEWLFATTKGMGSAVSGPVSFHKQVNKTIINLSESQRWVITRNDHSYINNKLKIEIGSNFVQQFMFENAGIISSLSSALRKSGLDDAAELKKIGFSNGEVNANPIMWALRESMLGIHENRQVDPKWIKLDPPFLHNLLDSLQSEPQRKWLERGLIQTFPAMNIEENLKERIFPLMAPLLFCHVWKRFIVKQSMCMQIVKTGNHTHIATDHWCKTKLHMNILCEDWNVLDNDKIPTSNCLMACEKLKVCSHFVLMQAISQETNHFCNCETCSFILIKTLKSAKKTVQSMGNKILENFPRIKTAFKIVDGLKPCDTVAEVLSDFLEKPKVFETLATCAQIVSYVTAASDVLRKCKSADIVMTVCVHITNELKRVFKSENTEMILSAVKHRLNLSTVEEHMLDRILNYSGNVFFLLDTSMLVHMFAVFGLQLSPMAHILEMCRFWLSESTENMHYKCASRAFDASSMVYLGLNNWFMSAKLCNSRIYFSSGLHVHDENFHDFIDYLDESKTGLRIPNIDVVTEVTFKHKKHDFPEPDDCGMLNEDASDNEQMAVLHSLLVNYNLQAPKDERVEHLEHVNCKCSAEFGHIISNNETLQECAGETTLMECALVARGNSITVWKEANRDLKHLQRVFLFNSDSLLPQIFCNTLVGKSGCEWLKKAVRATSDTCFISFD